MTTEQKHTPMEAYQGNAIILPSWIEKELRDFVVTACNSHEAIVAENKELREALALLVNAAEIEANGKGLGGYLAARLSDARDVLAKGGK